MSEILLIRHGQASFGTADYDRLSPLGHEQARALGAALARHDMVPDALFIGTQRRHRETLAGVAPALGLDPAAAESLPGLDEFDTDGLMAAHFAETGAPEGLNRDRRAHFRALRDSVQAWQRDAIADPPERWPDFEARVRSALQRLAGCGARRVLVVSSGGPIARIVTEVLEAPAAQMMRLQLQTRNCAVTRLVVGRSGIYLLGFNEMPHVTSAADDRLVTYS